MDVEGTPGLQGRNSFIFFEKVSTFTIHYSRWASFQWSLVFGRTIPSELEKHNHKSQIPRNKY
jgi:hypothetical protein